MIGASIMKELKMCLPCREKFVECHSKEVIEAWLSFVCRKVQGLTKLNDACIASKFISLNRIVNKKNLPLQVVNNQKLVIAINVTTC